MLRHLTSKIKATGPISVAEYMREVLTNPVTVSDAPGARTVSVVTSLRLMWALRVTT